MITRTNESKFNEMKINFENLRIYNQKLNNEIQEQKRAKVEVRIYFYIFKT